MPPVYYPAVIDRSASGFGISFPDFPGCIANGSTVSETAANGEAALAFHLDAMRDDGDAIPAPSEFDASELLTHDTDVVALLVRAVMPAKFSRIQVTLEDSLLAAIDAVAPNRSGFLSEAARAHLNKGEVVKRGGNYTINSRKPKHQLV